MTPGELMRFLQYLFIEASKLEGYEKSRIASRLRGLRSSMKLSGLFDIENLNDQLDNDFKYRWDKSI